MRQIVLHHLGFALGEAAEIEDDHVGEETLFVKDADLDRHLVELHSELVDHHENNPASGWNLLDVIELELEIAILGVGAGNSGNRGQAQHQRYHRGKPHAIILSSDAGTSRQDNRSSGQPYQSLFPRYNHCNNVFTAIFMARKALLAAYLM